MAAAYLLLCISPTGVSSMAHPNWKHTWLGILENVVQHSQVDRSKLNQSRSRKSEAEILFFVCWLISVILSIPRSTVLHSHLSLQHRRRTINCVMQKPLHSGFHWCLANGQCWHEEWTGREKVGIVISHLLHVWLQFLQWLHSTPVTAALQRLLFSSSVFSKLLKQHLFLLPFRSMTSNDVTLSLVPGYPVSLMIPSTFPT